MRRLQYKFPNQIRISGWDFGSSARAMNQAGGKDSLMTYESVRELETQADLEKVSRSTTERKSMSTKTSIKRIALVAVAGLGLGMLSAVSSVADTRQTAITNDGGAEYVTSIAVATNYAPVAGSTGTAVEHTVYFKTSTATVASTNYNPSVVLSSKPSTSTLAEDGSYDTAAPTSGIWRFVTAAVSGSTYSSTQTMAASRAISTVAAAVNGTYAYNAQYLSVRYDVAGTYKWTFWNDLNADGKVNGPEFSYVQSVVVGAESSAQGLKATTTTFGSSSVKKTASTYGQYGALIRIALTDTAGNAANVDSSGGIKVSVSGSGVVAYVNNVATSGSPSTYTLGQNDFDGSGYAWINVTNATAETVTVSLAGTGSAGNFTAPAAAAITYRTSATTDTDFAATTTTLTNTATEQVLVTAGVASTGYFKTGGTTASTYDQVKVTDSSGRITGKSNAIYDLAVAQDSTSGATNPGSFSITATFKAANETYQLTVNAGSAGTVTAATAALDDFVVTSPTVKSWLAAAGSKQTVTVVAVDQFGNEMKNVTVSGSISGRNSTVVLSNAVTGADGVATLSYTDASTSTTSMVDTLTLSSGSESEVYTITYTSAANLGASTVSLVTPSETTAGTVNAPIVYSAIKAGDGAEAGQVSVTATVKNADGVVLSGVPVTFTVAGSGVAITSTTKTVYTGTTGTATAKLYAWLAGTYTVTATAGTVSDTAVSSWSQEDGTYARTVSAEGKGGSVIATVKDRFGNRVKGVELTATRVGTGSFGGASSIKGTTAADGTVEFILTGGTGTVTVAFSSSTFGQSDALKGLIDGTTSTSTFTAYTAGDSLTDEEGVGASFDAAGINSATADASDASPSDSIDAANEATEAANAATDAANAAAEAADAATAAAQDAQAAVADLAAQVATLISGIKAQITRLTNLVIKIQKKVNA
jgi:hypothetical protein